MHEIAVILDQLPKLEVVILVLELLDTLFADWEIVNNPASRRNAICLLVKSFLSHPIWFMMKSPNRLETHVLLRTKQLKVVPSMV